MTDFLRNRPASPPLACLILAHGAGAAMDSDWMNVLAEGLCARRVEVWRFEFPYMAARRRGGPRRPPDRQAVLLDCWRDQIQSARAHWPPEFPLLIGGKSLGGRMASLLADDMSVDGLICLGYPFHPAGKPDTLRVAHLQSLRRPGLIVQGTRDRLGSRAEVAGYELAESLELTWLEDGDHDFKPRVSSGYRHDQHLASAIAAVADFIQRRVTQ